MPRVILDYDPDQPQAPAFEADTSDLVYFLSWAFSQRYGANHELSQAAVILRSDYKIDLTPLLTFADREIEDPDDADVLERSWQDATPLADCCDRVVDTIRHDTDRLGTLLDEYPALAGNIKELGDIARWAAARPAQIRITYKLDSE